MKKLTNIKMRRHLPYALPLIAAVLVPGELAIPAPVPAYVPPPVQRASAPIVTPVSVAAPEPVVHFSSGHDRSVLSERTQWVSGLTCFRKGDMKTSATHFKQLWDAEHEELSSDDRAALAYWAYRANSLAGDAPNAVQFLKAASAEEPGFYSILARRIAGLNMPKVSMDEESYPLPNWTPTVGYRLEPALLFAIIRQESGFNPRAHNPSGAAGVMQLMPATAHAMAVDARLKVNRSPGVNMSLGQHYLERLMEEEAIGDNLIYLLAAYNAGPGSVAKWQKNLQYNNDPLLFVESIPFCQTRNYVIYVTGNYWVYKAMLSQEENPSVTALAQGQWPRYIASQNQVAMMINRVNTHEVE